MISQRRERIPDEVWESHKPKIHQLYMEQDIRLEGPDGVMGIMSQQFAFSASKSQYETRLKKWNFRKYSKSSHAKDAEPSAQSNVLARKMRKEAQRQETRRSTDRQQVTPTSATPTPLSNPNHLPFQLQPTTSVNLFTQQTVTQQTVLPSRQKKCMGSPAEFSDWEHLPMEQFEPLLALDYDGNGLGSLDGTCLDMQGNTSPWPSPTTRETPDPGFSVVSGSRDIAQWPFETAIHVSGTYAPLALSIEIILPAVRQMLQLFNLAADSFFLPLDRFCPPEQCALIKSNSFELHYVHFVMSRLANNFDVSSLTDPNDDVELLYQAAIKYILALPEHQLERFLDAADRTFGMAVQTGLFCAAVELNNVAVVEKALRRGQDPNTTCCYFHGSPVNPLHRACNLRHEKIVHMLLRSGADPNPRADNEGSPLDQILNGLWLGPSAWEQPSESALGIVRSLMKHRSTFSSFTLSRVLEHCDSETLIVLVDGVVQYCPEIFITFDRTLFSLLVRDDQEATTHAIKSIVGQEFPSSLRQSLKWQEVWSLALQFACRKQSIETIQVIVERGGVLTDECLIYAIYNDNVDAVRFLMSLGLNPNATPHLHQRDKLDVHGLEDILLPQYGINRTAIGEAIRSQSSEVLQIFQEYGFMAKIKETRVGHYTAIAAAAFIGDTKLVDSLLPLCRYPPDHRWLRYSLDEPITAAVTQGHQSIVDKLLVAGFSPDWTSLIAAVRTQQPELAKLFFQAIPPGTWIEDRISAEAYMYSIDFGYEDITSMLIETPMPVDTCFVVSHKIEGMGRSECRVTPLSFAILKRKQSMVESILGAKPNLDYQINWRIHPATTPITPLSACVAVMDMRLLQRLLDLGANPADDMALFIAISLKATDFILAIINAATRRFDGGSASFAFLAALRAMLTDDLFHFQLIAKHVAIRKPAEHRLYTSWLDAPEDHWLNTLGTAIRLSCREQKSQYLNILFGAGHNPNNAVYTDYPSNRDANTALLFAIDFGHMRTIEIIVKAGADINLPTGHLVRQTALQAAAERGKKEIVEYLLCQGAEVNAQPALYGGATALQFAAIKGFMDIATLLVQHGADVNAPAARYQGRTAFEGAAEHGRIDMMMYLVQQGADILAGEQCKRAMEFAEKNGQMPARDLAQRLYDGAAVQRAVGAMVTAEGGGATLVSKPRGSVGEEDWEFLGGLVQAGGMEGFGGAILQ